MSDAIENVLRQLRGVRPIGEGKWQACCPAHEDRSPSLSISIGEDGRVLLYCHAGCRLSDICSAMKLALTDLGPSGCGQRAGGGRKRIVATYDYRDAHGALLFQVVRYDPKGFKQRRPDGQGGWLWNLRGVPRVLYRLPELLAKPGEIVWIVEGEKDADRLAGLGMVATSCPGGAGKWSKVDDSPLEGRAVVVVPDADDVGRRHAQDIARRVHGRAASVRIVSLDGVPEHGDISDWLDAGHDVEALSQLIQVVAPWEPAADKVSSGSGDASSGDGAKRAGSQATKLVKLARELGVELFHDKDEIAFAEVPAEQHREVWAIRSSGFKQWLARAYYRAHDRVANAQEFGDALGVLEGQARFDGLEHEVFVRVGGVGDAGDAGFAIFLDLGDRLWRAVRVDAGGWAIVEHPPIRFRRPRGMHALPDPDRGGTIAELRSYINVATDGDFALIASWLVAAYWPVGPYPILALHGEQGSAKSTCARLLRSLIDPNAAPLRSPPREVRDLMIAAWNGWALVFDNLSQIRQWTSDALCQMSTGGGLGTRELYSDRDEVIFNAMRPVMINGITELGDREDLLDRTIQVILPTIPEPRRRTERDLWRDFQVARPRLLGAVLDALSLSVRNAPAIRLEALPRMADFAVRAVAAEGAMPWASGTFIQAYADVRAASHELTIEASSVGQVVLAWMVGREEWSGTATELLAELEALAEEKIVRRQDWPKRPRDLSAVLRRLAPTLRVLGVEVEFGRPGGRRLIHIRKCGRSSVISVTSGTMATGTTDNAGGGDAEVTQGDAEAATTRSAASPGSCVLAPEKPVGDAGDADDADQRPLSAGADEEVEWVL